MRCLPGGTDDIINVETDSIYFDMKHFDTFVANVGKIVSNYPVSFGTDADAPLGSVKQEYDTTGCGPSYFLRKKIYCLGKAEERVGRHLQYVAGKPTMVDGPYMAVKAMKAKGIPMSTIDATGNAICTVHLGLYESVYAGHATTCTFSTMKKSLWKTQTTDACSIASCYDVSRDVNPMRDSYGQVAYKQWD
jgi:hypothetical protein